MAVLTVIVSSVGSAVAVGSALHETSCLLTLGFVIA